MPEPCFTVMPDLGRKLIRIVMRGFWNAGTIASYDAEITRVASGMIAAGCPLREMVALNDARDLSAQSQDLVAAYKKRFEAPERQPRRVATIVSSALFKRQVERIAIPNQRIFSDEDEAMRWLFSPVSAE